MTKVVILAGGLGTRLYPLTKGISKQLLPVYDKPMIYYPLSTLMNAGIREILIISNEIDLPRFKDVFGDGKKLGLNISYKIQNEPRGIAEAFIIGADFIDKSNVCLILGDNIFFGDGFDKLLIKANENVKKNYSTIFSVKVNNPKEFGVIEFSDDNRISNIIEKPLKTSSQHIVSGLYFYTNDVIKVSKGLKPSSRGELEISDINNYFLNINKLKYINLDKTFFWSDTGTYDSLLKTSKFLLEVEKKTSKKVACIEEIALKNGYINDTQFIRIANSMSESDYGKYLLNLIKKSEN